MEIMVESQCKISSLEEIFKEQNNSYETLQNNLLSLKASNCENYVSLETDEKLRDIIKQKHKELLGCAQLLYMSCQDISKEIDTCQSKWKTNSELGDYLKIKQMEYDKKEKELVQQSKLIGTTFEKVEYAFNKEKDTNALLKIELDTLEIKECEHFQSNSESNLDEKEAYEDNVNQKISEECFIIDEETIKITAQLQEKENLFQEITETENNLTHLEEELSSKNDAVTMIKTEIETLVQELEDIQDQLESFNRSIKLNESELNNYLKEVEYNNNEKIVNDENNKNQVIILHKRICEKEIILLQQEQYKSNISEEILSTTSKIDILNTDLSEINDYVNKTKDTVIFNLEKQVCSAESDLQNIKQVLKEIKFEHNKKIKDIDVKNKKLENEITELDIKIKNQQEAIAALENNLSHNEYKKNNFTSMTEKQKQILSELETEKTKLKSLIFDKQKETLLVPKRIPRKKSRMEPLLKHSNWDSDSSMEGVNNSLSLKAKRNIERKIQRNIKK